MNKDIQEINKLSDWLKKFHHPHAGKVQALDRIIKEWERRFPYEPGEPIEVRRKGKEWVKAEFLMVTSGGYVVACGKEDIRYWHEHRPIPKTVQVALDKEIKEAAKIGNQLMSLDGPISIEDQQILTARKFVCNAIASQEGEDNEQM